MKYSIAYLRPSEEEKGYTFNARDRENNDIAMSLCESGDLVWLCIETTTSDGSRNTTKMNGYDLSGLRAVFGKMVYAATGRQFVFASDIFDGIPIGSGLEFKLGTEGRCRSKCRR